jgi:uncharacterized protein YyaL (SSP411 family)
MAHVLNILGVFLYNPDYTEKVRHMLSAMENRFTRFPAAYANWASLAFSGTREQYVIAVIGSDSVAFVRKLMAANKSGALIFGSRSESNLPYFANRYVEGKTLIYICSGSLCLVPVENVEDALMLIANRNSG